jgi:hypothetical protein
MLLSRPLIQFLEIFRGCNKKYGGGNSRLGRMWRAWISKAGRTIRILEVLGNENVGDSVLVGRD